jgi:hypothetical protein
MTKYGRLIVNTRPGNIEIYLDGQPVFDSLGRIAKSPTLILNVSEGIHNVTFSKDGYDSVTVMTNVQEGFDSNVKAILNTSQIRYPMMLSAQTDPYIESLQPSPGWPTLPIPQITYGHIVANTIPDGAEVYMDGQPVFDTVGRVVTTPVTILDIITGVHRVTFKKQGYFDENVDVLIQNGLYSDAYTTLRIMALTDNSYILSDYDNMLSSYIEPKWYMEPDYMQPYYSQSYYLQPKQRGTVHFDTQPHGAIITVDGQYIVDPDTEEYIRTPATVLLFEGRRDFVLKLDGHNDTVGYVDVYAGSRVDIFRNMESIPGSNIRWTYLLPYPYYPGYGDLLIDSNPQGGYIYIDGYPLLDDIGNVVLTPVKATGMMEGFHEVRIAKDGYYEKQIIVNIISGQDNRAFANLQPVYG